MFATKQQQQNLISQYLLQPRFISLWLLLNLKRCRVQRQKFHRIVGGESKRGVFLVQLSRVSLKIQSNVVGGNSTNRAALVYATLRKKEKVF